ncbi:hypothetical protein [Paraflavitalea speifideaquila]|uniref:hypothetical protein n=1 Tax=Paraflavitalea speifideaquila TaxID=3076558 RepID=UPI0028E71191|nr:hypothetical protein [Paraflavitalea speifideiaquila]
MSLVPVLSNDRSRSLTHAKACMLEKVSYPTGGYTVFDYELKYSGGLRVRSVKDFDMNNALTSVKEYEYDQLRAAIGGVYSKHIQYNTMACVATGHPKGLISCEKIETYSDPVIDVYSSFYGDATERYGKVTEYYGTGGTNGKIEYQYRNHEQDLSPRVGMPDMADLLISKTVYRKVGSAYEPVTKEVKIYETLAESENSSTFFPGCN